MGSNLIRSTWPKVRSEKKNGLLGYVVDARGNGWSGKQKFYTRSKNKALKIAKLLAADYRELGAEAARFKIEDYAIYKTWTGLLNKTRQCFGQPDLSMDRIFEEYHSQKKARSNAYDDVFFLRFYNKSDQISNCNNRKTGEQDRERKHSLK